MARGLPGVAEMLSTCEHAGVCGAGAAGSGGDAVHVSMLASVARVLPGVGEVHRCGPHELAGVWYPFRFLCALRRVAPARASPNETSKKTFPLHCLPGLLNARTGQGVQRRPQGKLALPGGPDLEKPRGPDGGAVVGTVSNAAAGSSESS